MGRPWSPGLCRSRALRHPNKASLSSAGAGSAGSVLQAIVVKRPITSCMSLEVRRPNDERCTAPWSVYIVKCADGSLYTGIAEDLARHGFVAADGLVRLLTSYKPIRETALNAARQHCRFAAECEHPRNQAPPHE